MIEGTVGGVGAATTGTGGKGIEMECFKGGGGGGSPFTLGGGSWEELTEELGTMLREGRRLLEGETLALLAGETRSDLLGERLCVRL